MSLPVDVSIRARSDLREILAFFKKHDAKLSGRFRAAVKEGFSTLATHPGLGRAEDYGEAAFAGMRLCRVPEFDKYLIFYRSFEDRIEIVRVVDGRRDLPKLFRSE